MPSKLTTAVLVFALGACASSPSSETPPALTTAPETTSSPPATEDTAPPAPASSVTLADCQADAMFCLGFGQCGMRDGKCVATPEGCAASVNCQTFGVCKVQGDKCAATAETCTGEICTTSGFCTAKEGWCEASAEACKASVNCKLIGACAAEVRPDSAPTTACVPGSDADCKASDLCKHSGQCRLAKTESGSECVK